MEFFAGVYGKVSGTAFDAADQVSHKIIGTLLFRAFIFLALARRWHRVSLRTSSGVAYGRAGRSTILSWHPDERSQAWVTILSVLCNCIQKGSPLNCLALLGSVLDVQPFANRPSERERIYRQSRLSRLLGNPVAFAVVDLLTNGKDLRTSEIAKAIGRSIPAPAIS